jgi:hypothetical protein
LEVKLVGIGIQSGFDSAFFNLQIDNRAKTMKGKLTPQDNANALLKVYRACGEMSLFLIVTTPKIESRALFGAVHLKPLSFRMIYLLSFSFFLRLPQEPSHNCSSDMNRLVTHSKQLHVLLLHNSLFSYIQFHSSSSRNLILYEAIFLQKSQPENPLNPQ